MVGPVRRANSAMPASSRSPRVNFSVVKAGPKFQLLASNQLQDDFTASPVVSNGKLYLRGFKSLYAIQESAK